jgi:uncharacterized SAM-dependent methyltransferase
MPEKEFKIITPGSQEKGLESGEEKEVKQRKKYEKPVIESVDKQTLEKKLLAQEKQRINETLEKIHRPQIQARLQKDLQLTKQPEQVKAESEPAATYEQTLVQKISNKSKDPFSYWSFFNARYFNQTGLLTPWHVFNRKLGLAVIKEQDYESFADVKVNNITIEDIEKLSEEKGWDPYLHSRGAGKIRGSIKVEGPLFGKKPAELAWVTYFNELYYSGDFLKYDLDVNFQEQISAWTNIDNPAISGKAEEIMSRYHLDKPFDLGKEIYRQALQKLANKIKEYVVANCLPYEFFRGDRSKTVVAMGAEISQEIDKEREWEIVTGLENHQFDEKIFYLGPGAEKYLEYLKSDENKLNNFELELIKKNLDKLASFIKKRTISDLGPANALKIIPLLEKQLESQKEVAYVPIDINPAMIFAAAANINNPKVKVEGKILDFTKPLAGKFESGPKFLTLLGNTLGNGDENYQRGLLKNINQAMTADDFLMVGIHLKSDWQEILKNYESASGREVFLSAVENIGFPLAKIDLEIIADEKNRQIKAMVKIKEDLKVRGVRFKQGENLTIFVSQKYDVGELENLAHSAGLEVEKTFRDEKNQYELAVLKKGK